MNTPKLRFKDDDGREFPEWEKKELEDIGENIIGLTYSPSNVTTDEAYPIVLRSSNIKDNVLALEDLVRVKEKISEKLFVKENDILICTRNGSQRLIGKNVLIKNIKIPITFGAFMSVFRSDCNDFVVHLFKTDDYLEQIQMNLGARINQITTKNLNKFKFNFPVREEQTKIANFLTAIDEKISQLTQKHDLLKQYKKGVMQQIFSQKLRFKDDDGREFPEWEIIELEKIAVKVTKKNKDLAINNVLTNSATQGVVNQSDYFDRDIANQSNLGGYYIVETDDFVYNPRISANALVGPIKRNNLTTGVMSPLYTVFRFKKGNLDFFEQYFQTNHWHDYMKSVSNSGARHDRMNITNESFLGLPISYPAEQEQTKIANFLTAIDDKITQAQTQLDAVKQYKKGLLQQLFV